MCINRKLWYCANDVKKTRGAKGKYRRGSFPFLASFDYWVNSKCSSYDSPMLLFLFVCARTVVQFLVLYVQVCVPNTRKRYVYLSNYSIAWTQSIARTITSVYLPIRLCVCLYSNAIPLFLQHTQHWDVWVSFLCVRVYGFVAHMDPLLSHINCAISLEFRFPFIHSFIAGAMNFVFSPGFYGNNT